MYCTQCGAYNPDTATNCCACGKQIRIWAQQGATPEAPVTDVPDYLVPAILITIFCFMPLGAVAIYFATQARERAAAGNRLGALEAARICKLLIWWSVGVGAGIVLLVLAAYAVFIWVMLQNMW